jgi:hypothetical protein
MSSRVDEFTTYNVGDKFIIDGVEETLIEDNGDRGFFQATDKRFDKWSFTPTTVYRYADLADCVRIGTGGTVSSKKAVKTKKPSAKRKSGKRSSSTPTSIRGMR